MGPPALDMTGLTEPERDEIAAVLRQAEETRVAVPRVSDAHAGMTVDDAYLVQLVNVAARLETGVTIGGHKVGLSSHAMQEQMGVGEPDYGHLLSDMFVAHDGEIDLDALIQPRVEVEPAFVLGAPLPAPGCTVDDVLRSTAAIVPAIEVIDSRIADWSLTLIDTVADNASSGRVVVGPARVAPGDVDLRDTEAVLSVNGTAIDHGNTNAVLGDPATAVAWLADKVHEFGVVLRAGHVVLPGSCMRAHPVSRGDHVEATIGALDRVAVRFR